MSSVHVTAHLDRPSVGLIERPFLLDGPVAWAVAELAKRDGIALPPATREHVPDLDLPFERWEQAGTWGWKVSRGRPAVEAYTAVEIRRKPATAEMARFTTEKKHHLGLGPHKARDTTVAAAWVTRIEWDAETTDETRLADLLSTVTHLGGHAAIGYGHVTKWQIEPGTPGAWADRPMPDTDPHEAVRAPYWHHSRRLHADL